MSVFSTWVSDELVKDLCGDSYQCQYDYATTLSKEFAMFSKYYQDQFVNIYENVLKPESIVSASQRDHRLRPGSAGHLLRAAPDTGQREEVHLRLRAGDDGEVRL